MEEEGGEREGLGEGEEEGVETRPLVYESLIKLRRETLVN